MKFHGIEMVGEFKNEIVSTTPAGGDVTNKARLVYATDTELLSVGDNSGNWSSVGQYGDIPVGTTILIESNTQITGYTLETDQDDDVVYITKGSVAGGETGGTAKSAGTWTQPDHTLIISEMPAHTHAISPPAVVLPGGISAFDGGSQISGLSVTQPTGGGLPHNHGTTWRPKGRNFTRQTRT